MRGVDELTALRLRGCDPGRVWLVVEPLAAPRWAWQRQLWHRGADGAAIATLRVDPAEVLGALDLRCLRGLDCTVFADDWRTGRAAFWRAQAFEPRSLCFVGDDLAVRQTEEAIEEWAP